MPIIVPPSTQPIPDGWGQGWNDYATFTVAHNDVLDVHLDSSTRNAGVSRTDFDFAIMDAGPPIAVIISRATTIAETNVNIHWVADRARTIILRLGGGGTPSPAFSGTAFGVTASLTPAVVVYCEHGTQITPGGAGLVQLTPALIEAVLTSAGVPELGFFFIPLYWSMFSTNTLCDQLPPPLPSVDFLDPTISWQTRFEIFQSVAWLSFCQCAPGTPTPTPPPAPVVVVPPGTPTAPVFPCDNVDPCAALVAIQQQLAALTSSLASTSQLVTLMQRYSEPFAYIPGAIHSGIHSSGSFAVSRLVGMRVTVVERPGSERLFSGVPNYISDLGWLSLLTGDGLIDEIRLTRDTQSWFPKLMPLATQFGISLRDGVVVDVQELEAEP